MWNRAVDGRVLHFHLRGINNQNFLMYDEETGSWWQQVTGECILGELKGKRLARIRSDEVSLETWRKEHPESTIVRLDHRYEYPKSNWDERTARLPVEGAPAGLPPRELVIGIELDGAAAAYPMALLRRQSPINSQVKGTPILMVVHGDGNSVRSFARPKHLEFYKKTDAAEWLLVDSGTGSEWDFSGRAIAGPMRGQILEPIQNTKDYWFDWKRYHPDTTVYQAGEALRRGEK